LAIIILFHQRNVLVEVISFAFADALPLSFPLDAYNLPKVRKDMNISKQTVQPVSVDAAPQDSDMNPLCGVGCTPSPASWEKRSPTDPLSGPPDLDGARARRRSYIAVTYITVAVATGLNLLTPLYGIYRRDFGFSALTLTLIFAVYVVTIIPAMLIFGPLADAFGRRRILLIALLASVLGAVLLLFASGTPWLFAARVAQGFAFSAVAGAGAAALLELGTNNRKTAFVIAASMNGGIALGPVIAGVLAQYAPVPLILIYLVYLVLLIPAFIGVFTMVEPLAAASRRPFRPHRPSLPANGKSTFLIATALAAFAFGAPALFLSVVPSFLAGLLHTTNTALLVAPVGLFLGMGTVAPIILHTLPARRSALIGLGLNVIGLIATLYATSIGSIPLLLIAAVIGGSGVGLAFVASLSFVNQVISQEERGDVFGTFYAVIYISFGGSALAVGLLTGPIGLTAAVRGVAVVVIVLCVVAAVAVTRLPRAAS
jgi:MFS family permease